MTATMLEPDALHTKAKTPFALHDAILDGLPYSTLTAFLKESGLPTADVLGVLGIPSRTLARRKAAGHLTAQESNLLLNLAELFGKTRDLFGGRAEAAATWLTKPRPVLGNRRPIDLAKTKVGTRQVETLVFQLDYGILV